MVERNEIYILKLIVKCNQSGIKWLKGIKLSKKKKKLWSAIVVELKIYWMVDMN